MSNLKLSVGVIVGRFQTPELTTGHKGLITQLLEKHTHVIIFLGVSPLLQSRRNPLPYVVREQMLREAFSNVSIFPIVDMKNDHKWSESLDKKIREAAPFADVTLYGGRDSFLKVYSGKHKTIEVTTIESLSGTEMRAKAASTPLPTKDFRAGIIYANFNRYPVCHPTVDIAIYDEDDKWLLGKKFNQDEWRFIGGFADPDTNPYEIDAKREVMEETGLEVGDLQYIGSTPVNDWRYEGEHDKIKTLFFKAKKVFGPAKGADDIEVVEWFKFEDIKPEMLVGEHRILFEMLCKNLERVRLHV